MPLQVQALQRVQAPVQLQVLKQLLLQVQLLLPVVMGYQYRHLDQVQPTAQGRWL